MGGLSDLGGVHMPPMFICPLYIWTPNHTSGHPPYVQQVLIGYLFSCIIKFFPPLILRQALGVVRLSGCPYTS